MSAAPSPSRLLPRWLTIACLAWIALTLSAHEAAAGKRRNRSDKGSTKVCTVKAGKKRCRREKVFTGHGVAKSKLRTEPLERPTGAIEIVAENLSESVAVKIYDDDGALDEAALAQLDEVFRCRRTDETRAVRPELYEMLSRIYDHFGQKRIHLVSGFRFAERDSSRHFHASAMDIKIEGVSARALFEFAESLDTGGMGIGIYPNSGFVHVDFRAPGEPSYRWRDLSGPSNGKRRSKDKRRTTPARKPVS
ncbi:MAG: DUF882 domain-containing protein [Kofleriaceae bacterium]